MDKKVFYISTFSLGFLIILLGLFFFFSSNEKISKEPVLESNNNYLNGGADTFEQNDWEKILLAMDKNFQSTTTNQFEEGLNNKTETLTFQSTTPETKTTTAPNTGEKTPEKIPVQQESALKIYGNKIGLMITEKINENVDEVSILNNLIQNPSAENYKKLDLITNSYKNLSQKLLSVTAPKEAIYLHQKLALSYQSFAEVFQEMANYKDSGAIPPQSVFEKQNVASVEIANSIVDAVRFFKQNSITFETNEGGYIFMIPIE